MNQDQITSIIRSILKIAGSALAAHGLTNAANLVNGEDVAGVAIAVAGLVWSHYNHSSTPSNSPKT